MEASVGAPRTLETLSDERFKSLADAIEARKKRIEQYEKEVFGEGEGGPLSQRMIKLEEML